MLWEGATMYKYKDTVCSHQSKDSSRSSYTDLLGHKVEAGDDTDDAGNKIDEQVA